MHEDWLKGHQDGRVYPVGRALRSTYGADNHDTLGTDVTGLMIDLSKVPFEPGADRADPVVEVPARPAEPPPGASALRPSILARVSGLLGLG